MKHVVMAEITIGKDKKKTVKNSNGECRIGKNVGKVGGGSWFKMLDLVC